MVVRKYRVRWMEQGPDGNYITRTKDFRSLRSAGEHIRDLAPTDEFREIVALEVHPLTDQERGALELFSEGRYRVKDEPG